MNKLCVDIGYSSILHTGEQLCGDHVEIARYDEDCSVIVLADGLGSGVKACILSTLTSRIISTMLASDLPLEECVLTIASTLPVCKERGVAYSTFTIIRIISNETAEIMRYDNPDVILLRDGIRIDYQKTLITIGNKKIYHSRIPLHENDLLLAMSDGCPHAGTGKEYNFGWRSEEIGAFMETVAPVGYTSKTLASMLTDECDRLYCHTPGDDATACIIKVRRREAVNLLFGPPSDRNEADKMMSLFFSKEGRHIVCGGTTSSIAAQYLHKPLVPKLEYIDRDIPPIAELEGADLVTEGVITVNRVLTNACDYLNDNKSYLKWSIKRDGASLISRMLFEEATDINFFVGRAINPAHQNPELPISFSIKMNLVKQLSECLERMGKKVKVSYF